MKRFIFLTMFLSIMSSGCAVVHHYEGYQGKVIDVDTKEPLEGVAVLVVFYTQQYGPAGSVSHYADAQETLTGKNGEFRIPSFTTTALEFTAVTPKPPNSSSPPSPDSATFTCLRVSRAR